jgi:hypothetical protein
MYKTGTETGAWSSCGRFHRLWERRYHCCPRLLERRTFLLVLGRIDRRVAHDAHAAWDGKGHEGTGRLEEVRAHDSDGNETHAGAARHREGALLEGAKSSVLGARALGEAAERHGEHDHDHERGTRSLEGWRELGCEVVART